MTSPPTSFKLIYVCIYILYIFRKLRSYWKYTFSVFYLRLYMSIFHVIKILNMVSIIIKMRSCLCNAYHVLSTVLSASQMLTYSVFIKTKIGPVITHFVDKKTEILTE